MPLLVALVVALACSALASTASAQPVPEALPPPYFTPAPWPGPPPPSCEGLPWVWGYPHPLAGPVWYLAPGAPIPQTGKPPEPPRPPRSKRDARKRTLTLTGAIGFGLTGIGATFAYSSAVTKYGFGSGWETILLPGIGPFLAAGVAEGVHESGGIQVPFLIAGGLVQSAFAAVFVAGLAQSSDRKPPVKGEAPAPEPSKPEPLSFVVVPTVSSTGGGLALGGAF